jgi:hypothetical protein
VTSGMAWRSRDTFWKLSESKPSARRAWNKSSDSSGVYPAGSVGLMYVDGRVGGLGVGVGVRAQDLFVRRRAGAADGRWRWERLSWLARVQLINGALSGASNG